MTGVDLEAVTKRYGGTEALREVDLSIRDGEFFTLVGPSGCGKTTTLRLVAGFESPTAGTVRFGGEDVAGVPPEDRGVGVVFQNYALFPHMSVGENVAYGLRFADPPGGGTTDERVADLLELVDLPGFADRDPAELSGGQRQRVALARALAPGPRVLLLDEPMSALDARLRERLRVKVKEIQSELGITTVYVTHDQEEALAVSDRVAVMQEGRIEQVGTPREVYRRPSTRFVAEFVGDNNVFAGEVSGVEGGIGTDGGFDVAVGDRTLRVAVGSEDDVDGFVGVGDRLTFCVRPAALERDAGTNRFPVEVRSTEFLGETTRIHGTWAGQDVLLRVGDEPSGTVTVGFDPREAHVLGVER